MPYSTSPGHPQPLGATVNDQGVNFSLFSQNATGVELLLFDSAHAAEPSQVIPVLQRTLFYWHVQVNGLRPNVPYAFRVDGPGTDADRRRFGHRFNRNKVLIDPYAKGNLTNLWVEELATDASDNVATSMRSVVIDTRDYDWEGDQRLNTPLSETIIYELHVRGFTRSPSSGVQHPGTFAGLMEKLPYLQSLGITALELMPVFDFDETTVKRRSPTTGEPLTNFWGYDPISFFAPEDSYCVSPDVATHVREFRDLIKAAHRHGLEVILDVVFNHTGEGDLNGPVISFKGIDNSVFYLLDGNDRSRYRGDLTGCGNALRCNHPFCSQMLADSLAYWVTEMHVDGFRFDLGAVLTLGEDGRRLEYPPIVWALNLDARFETTKVIVEPFGGNNEDVLGSFPDIRAATWNFHFKNTMRRFARGDRGLVAEVATRIAGSSDLLQGAGYGPLNGVSYLTCHDGFTLNDLVSYARSHNEANGEVSGDADNLSFNCGTEGRTVDRGVEELRLRTMRNCFALLLLSQGVPMLLAGDECRRSQDGNNNPYLQDNEVSWFDWSLVARHAELVDLVRFLTAFRQRHPALRRSEFFRGEPSQRGLRDIEFHGCELNAPGFSDPNSAVLAVTVADPGEGEDLFLIFNMELGSLPFQLPPVIGRRWSRALDTALRDAVVWAAPGTEVAIESCSYVASGRSVVVLVSKA
ncbi:MAG: glycogen-debranching protein [Pseudomonadota bacterium]